MTNAAWPPRVTRALHVLLAVLLLGSLAFAATTGLNTLHSAPGVDSGVFLYGGWRVLDGDRLYADFWDHKGPVLFWLNAAGLALGGGDQRGVWLIEALGLALTFGLLFAVARRHAGVWAAGVAVAFGLLQWLQAAVGGNFTTTHVLPLIAGALALSLDAEEHGRWGWRAFAVGVLGGLAFLLRQNLVAFWVALAVYLTVSRLRAGQVRAWLTIGVLGVAGALLPIVAVVIWFAARGTLAAWWDATVTFNLAYSAAATWPDRLAAFQNMLGLRPLWLAVGASLLGTVWAVMRGPRTRLVWLLLLWLPVEVLFALTSGRTTRTYLTPTILPVVLGIALLVAQVVVLTRNFTKRARQVLVSAIILSTFGVASLLPWVASQEAVARTGHNRNFGLLRSYLDAHLAQDAYYYVWGTMGVGIAFEQNHILPYGITYITPLFTRGDPATERRTTELARNFCSHPPTMFVFNERITLPTPSVVRAYFDTPVRYRFEDRYVEAPPNIDLLFSFIEANYGPPERIERTNFAAMRRTDAPLVCPLDAAAPA